MCILVLRVRPTPTRFPTNTPLPFIPSVWCPWDTGCRQLNKHQQGRLKRPYSSQKRCLFMSAFDGHQRIRSFILPGWIFLSVKISFSLADGQLLKPDPSYLWRNMLFYFEFESDWKCLYEWLVYGIVGNLGSTLQISVEQEHIQTSRCFNSPDAKRSICWILVSQVVKTAA